MMNCTNLKVRQKSGRRFLYCQKSKKEISFESCKNCIFKEYRKKKTTKKYNNKNSILPAFIIKIPEDDIEIHCYNKRIPYWHKNHIFEGNGKRQLSDKYGLFIWIAPENHLACFKKSVHSNIKIQNELKKIAQKEFQRHYPDLDFVEIFGRNYL